MLLWKCFATLRTLSLKNENLNLCIIWAYEFDDLSPVSGVGLYTSTNGMQQTQAKKGSWCSRQKTNNENILRFEPNFRFCPKKFLILFFSLQNRKLHSKVNVAALQSVKLERFSWWWFLTFSTWQWLWNVHILTKYVEHRKPLCQWWWTLWQVKWVAYPSWLSKCPSKRLKVPLAKTVTLTVRVNEALATKFLWFVDILYKYIPFFL